MLSIPQLEKLRKIDPYLYETVVQLRDAINAVAKQTGADPKGVFALTPNITAVNVTVANGFFNVQIVDNAFVNNPQLQGRAITYFVEFATDAGFTHVVHHEAWHSVRNQNVSLGSQTLFVRAYSQVQGSPPSSPVAAVGNPFVGGGSVVPAQQTYQGSGNSVNSGQGYGATPRSPGTTGNPRLALQ